MTRRDILVGGIGTALGLSGCQAVTSSMSGATAKGLQSVSRDALREGESRSQQQSEPQVPRLEIENVREIARFPALFAYVQSMKDIPGGRFRKGFYHGQSQAAPWVEVNAFRMGKTPITWEIWKEYCDAESVGLPKEPFWASDNHPVVNVSYDDLVGTNGRVGFCGWVSRLSGLNVTLPTSIQFEYASRGGVDGLDYPWGNQFDTSKLWCAAKEGEIVGTGAVDRKDRIFQNGYGLTDMVGNVWQWCLDYHRYSDEFIKNVTSNVKQNYERRLMSGSWVYGADQPEVYTCNVISSYEPDYRSVDVGFRLVALS
jgi:formylglycine-generating enzyme required for sulfatase activity